MKSDRRVAIVAGLVLVLLIAFSAIASPPPLPSSFYGTIGATGFSVPSGTKVSAWVGGVKLAEVPVFTADGATAFVIDVPGDIPETAAVEGGREGETIVFKVGGAPAPQTGVWHTGNYERRDLTVAAGADLAVSVDDGQESAVPGTLLTYTLTVRNLGSQMAKGVVLTDTLPSTVTADSLDGGTLQGNVITWPAFDLEAGASTIRTVTVLVNLTLPVDTEAIVNDAAVAHDGSQGLDPNSANDSDLDSDELFLAPDFAITDGDLAVTPAQPAPGTSVTVDLTVRNPGFKEATGLVVIYNGRPYSGTVVGSRTVTVPKQGSLPLTFTFTAGESTVLVSAAVDPDGEVDEVSEGNNTARRFLANVADLAIGIDNFLLTPTAARAGDAVAVSVTVRNGGRLAAADVPVEVFDGEPGFGGVSIFSTTIPSLLPGANQTVSFSWTATEGDHQLTVVVDLADTILEMFENNNQAVRDLRVPRAAGPDLTVPSVDISGLTQSPVTLVAGGTVRATIANTGDAAAGVPFAARLFEDRDGDGSFSAGDRELARQEMPAGLAAGGSATAVFSVQGALELYHPLIWVEADADGVITELKEDNNLAACFGGCEIPVPPSPGVTPVVEWYLGGMEVESAPMVAQLSDDNGDGRIDSRDVPDVVFIGEDSAGPAVMARSGVDGTEVWTFRSTVADPLSSRLSHVAAADLDGDGVAEVLAAGRNGRLLAIDHHGQKLWASDPVEGLTFRWMGGPSVADLTGDGVPEIVLGRTVLSNTGTLIAKGTADRGRNYWYYSGFGYPLHGRADDQAHSIVADVDLDGRPEIVAGSTLYRLEGNQLVVVWERVIPDNLMPDGFTAVANLDADPQAEIVYVSSGLVIVLNHDGTLAVNYRRVIPFSPLVQPNGWSGPPTIADLDGDGKPEILVAGATELVAMRSNLATYWRAPVFDVDAQTAATVFDLDGDGAPEVLYRDQDNFYILNGQTGAVRHSRPVKSKTANEYPVVADVDNDGQAEILVPSTTSFGNDDATTRGLHVLGNPGWRGTRPIWNQFSYHVTNVQLDGTVPSPETPSWQAGNNYRVNESQASRPHARPNATVGLPRVGAPVSTGAPVRLRVGNGGRGVLPAGTAVVLYAGDPAENVVAAETKTTRALQPGAWQDLLVYWQRPGPAGAPATAVVDPQGLVEECDEADNAVGFGVTETVLPDLSVPAGGLTVQASPVAGQKVTVNVKVDNVGSAQAAASVIRLYDGPPSLAALVGEAPLPAVAPGASVTVVVPWETLGAAGTHTVYAVADGADTVVELDEANNQGSVEATLTAATKPDPSAETLVIDPATVTVGTPVRLALEVANRGTALPDGFVVAFRVNNAEVARATSADPFEAGGRRTVETTLQTLSLNGRQQIEARIDPNHGIDEQNESNNSQGGTLDIASPGATATLSTERVSYASNDTATLTLKVQNATTAAKDLSVRITIQNASGALVATVSDQAASYPPGTTTETYTWGTGATPAGAYAAVAEVSQNGTVIARASSPFSILGDRSASAQIFADRDHYEPTQSAALSGRVRNMGVNQSLTNLQAKVTATGPAGTVVFTATQTIALLSPGAEASVDAVWPIANAAPGLYSVRLEVRDDGGALLAFTSIGVTVLDSAQTGAGLSGELAVSPEMVGSGGLLLARFSTSNGGNADMPALRLRLRLERISDETAVASEEIPWPLARNQQRSGSLGQSTAGFEEGQYVAVLEGLLPGGELVLGRAPFQVVHGLSVSDARVVEGDSGTTQAVFEVTLSSAAAGEVTADYATANGTAEAGEDYETASGTLTFQPGEIRKTVAVNVLGDTVPESEEVFLLTLGNPVGARLGDGQALGAIADEEGCPSPNLLADGGAEEGAGDSGLPGWTAVSGSWKRRFADPVPLDGLASIAAGGSELLQDIDLSPYAAWIDAGGQGFLFEGFVQSLVDDGAQVIVEYRDAANASVLASFDSSEIVSAGAWQAVVDARTVPAGTRWARVRLLGLDHGTAGIDAFFDRLGLRSLGVPVLSVAAPSVVEGNTGTVVARFELRLSCPAPASLDVAFATADGTATAGSDYDAVSGTVTFAPGEELKTVDVPVRGDLVDEADETFFLDLTAGSSGMVVLDFRSTGSIGDDDGPASVSVADAYVDEGDAGPVEARFTVSLPGPSGKTVKVNYATVAGTAAVGGDFTAVSGTLTFAPGVESLEVAVPVKGDLVDEADETFTLRLSSPVNASIADADGAGTILDDDQAELSIADAAVLEGHGEAVSFVFPVTLSRAADREVRVSYATVDGTAVAGTDYQAATGTLVFAPGTASATVTVPVLGNRTEQLDRTLLVRLDAPQVATLADPEAQGTIRDDDGILIQISGQSTPDVIVTEGDSGTANATLFVKVSNNNTKTVTIDYSTVNGTAGSPDDFTAVTGTLTFPPGTTSLPLTVPVVGDLVEEVLAETFQVVLSNPSVGSLQRPAATVTVADNDGWALNGRDARFGVIPGCIQLISGFNTSSSAWKKQPIHLTKSFDQTYQVYLGANDGGADGLTFTLQQAGLNVLGEGGGYLGIRHLAPAFSAVSVELDNYSNGWDPAFDHIAVDVNGDVNHVASTVTPTTANSANVEDGRLHDLRVVWNATSKLLDVHFDGSERLVHGIDLLAQLFHNNPPVFFGITAGSGSVYNDHYFCPTVQCADPSKPTQVSVGDTRVLEGSSGTTSMVFPVTLSCPSAQPVTVSVATADGTARAGSDYTAVHRTVTFLPGETSQDVVVSLLGDVEPEPDETLTLNLSEPVNGTVRYAQGVGTILFDDAGVSVYPARITEGNTSTGTASDFYVELVLSAPFTAPVSFNWQTADGTALAGSDYTAASGTVTFSPGQTRKSIKLRLLGDTVAESDETFSLRFTNVANATIPPSVDLTIVDDEECQGANLLVNPGADDALVNGELPGWVEVQGASWTRDSGGVPTLEGNFFRAFREPVAELRQDVDLSAYASTIAAGRQRFLFQGWVETYSGDAVQDLSRIVVEFLDPAKVNVLGRYDTGDLQSPNIWRRVGDVLNVPAGTAWARVRLIATRAPGATDNVDAFFDSLVLRSYGTPELSVNDQSELEGSSGVGKITFTVSLACPNTQTVKVDYLTTDGTAQAGTDYQATFGSLTFAPGETSRTIDVPVIGDVFSEGSETFFLTLANAVNAGISRPRATGTIQEDESTVKIYDFSLNEGNAGQTSQAVFQVSLTKPSNVPVSVDWSTANDTATAGSDYVAASGTLQFPPDTVNQTISVTVLGDTGVEPDETFFVRLSNPSLVTIADGEAVGKIVHDDLSISIGDVSVVEGNTGIAAALFQVSLSQPSSNTVTVEYRTEDRTATAGQDYTAVTNDKVTFAPGERVKTAKVEVKGDTLAETGEIFTAVLFNPVNASILNGEGTGTIADDDDCPSPNLLKNPDAEAELVGNEVPGWTEAVGTTWRRSNSRAFTGSYSFHAGDGGNDGELRQDVDVSAYASYVDAGIQRFSLLGWVFVNSKTAPDTGRVVLEYRDADNQTVLGQYDSGIVTVTGAWQQTASFGLVPPGTRWLRVRLLSHRTAASGNPDVYFDGFDLRSVGTPVFTVPDVALAEGIAGTKTFTFPVTLSCVQTVPVSVGYATVEDGAEQGLDYEPVSGTLTFQPGQTVLNVPVAVLGDTRVEGDERFVLELRSSSGPVLLTPRATGTILDDDRPASVNLTGTLRDMKDTHPDFEKEIANDLGIVESLLGPDKKPVYASATRTTTTHGQAAFDQWFRDVEGVNLAIPYTITLTPTAADPRIFRYSNEAFWPIDNQLFGNQGRNHNFHMTYEIHSRFLYGGNEIFRFYGDDDIWVFLNGKLALDMGGVHTPYRDTIDLDAKAAELGLVVGQVYDFDIFWAERHTVGSSFEMETTLAFGAVDPGVLQFSVPTYEVTENGTVATISVVRTRGADTEVSVTWSTADGTAAAPGDYTPVTGTFTFRDGETGPKTFTIPVSDDSTVEPAETINLILSNPTGGAEIGQPAVLTVQDDDAVSEPDLAARKTASLAADNDNNGQPSPGDVLRYEIVIENLGSGGATGIVLDDPAPLHMAVVPGSVTSTQGTIVSESPVKVILGDLAAGASAMIRFDVKINSPVPAGVKDVRNQGMVASRELPTVLTDDPALGGDADVTVTAITAAPVLVAEKTAELAADGDADGNGVPSPGDTIEYLVTVHNRGNTSATAVVVDDPVPSHTSLVDGSVSPSQGTVESTSPSVRVALGEIAGGESATVRFRVRVASPIPAGIREVSNQAMVSSAELAAVKSDDPTAGGAADPTVTRITAAPVLVVEKKSMLAEDHDGDTVASPGDTLLYRITIANRGNTPATDVKLYDTIDLDTDYEAGSLQVSQGSIVTEQPVEATLGEIGAGETATATFRVAVDAAFPTNRTEVANQARVTSLELSEVLSDDPETAAPGDATRTPVFLTPSASIDDVTVSENDGTASLAVTLSFASNREVRIDYATADNSATAGVDFTAGSGTLVFAPGETTQTITVPIVDDLLDELDETFAVNLTDPVRSVLSDAEAIATITDDDAAPVVTVSSASVSESAGTAELTVTLSAPSGLEVRVDYTTADGTALAGADYTAVNGTLTFPAGTTSLAVSVPVTNDPLDEEEETFLVNLSNPVNVTVGSAGTVTITDDDETPSISVASVSVAEEAGAAGVTVTLSAPSGREVRVEYATADGTAIAGADYTAKSEPLVFAAGTTSLTLSIPVTHDVLDEVDETFQINLSNPVNATIGNGGTVTIVDDDAEPSLSISDLSIEEGDSETTAELTVTLSAVSGREVQFAFGTSDGTAVAGEDYEVTPIPVTIPAGTLTATVQVQIVGDEVDELDETFSVLLSALVAATLEDAEGEVTILDDDEALARIDDVRVMEGNQGTTDAVFTVRLSVPSDRQVQIDYATAEDTATEGTDYQAAADTLTFAPGETQKTVTVKVNGDILLEGNETFTVDLANAVNAGIEDGHGTGTIVDDEACLSPNLLANPGAEQSAQNIGTVPGWTVIAGTEWQTRGANPQPAEGTAYFYAGKAPYAELVQDVDVSAYADRIATGNQIFAFEGRVRTLDEVPPDVARIVVEYLDASKAVVLYAFDTGEIMSPLEWQRVADTRPAPVGTAWIRVRLLATQFQASSTDAWFDALSLRSQGTATVTINDVTVYENQSGTRDAVFNVTLSCPVAGPVSVPYATADGTALAGSDYLAVSGTLTFPSGTQQQTIAVPVIGDAVHERHETFTVQLGPASSGLAVTLDPVGLGTILNDDFCARSPGFWKTHTEVWPLSSLVIGTRRYSAAEMLAFLDYNGPDASRHLARQLIATRLNLAVGSNPSILPVADASDAFLAIFPPGSNPSGANKTQANALKDQLDAYNNPSCQQVPVIPAN